MLFSPHTYPSMHWGLFIRNKKKESLICVRFRQRAPPTHSHTQTHTHTHLRTSWAGSSRTVRLSHIKEPGVLWHRWDSCPFYKKTNKQRAWDAVQSCFWHRVEMGDLALWHIGSTCLKKLWSFLLDVASRLSSAYSKKIQILSVNVPFCAFLSEVHGKCYF